VLGTAALAGSGLNWVSHVSIHAPAAAVPALTLLS
jgi:hypothetical protein